MKLYFKAVVEEDHAESVCSKIAGTPYTAVHDYMNKRNLYTLEFIKQISKWKHITLITVGIRKLKDEAIDDAVPSFFLSLNEPIILAYFEEDERMWLCVTSGVVISVGVP